MTEGLPQGMSVDKGHRPSSTGLMPVTETAMNPFCSLADVPVESMEETGLGKRAKAGRGTTKRWTGCGRQAHFLRHPGPHEGMPKSQTNAVCTPTLCLRLMQATEQQLGAHAQKQTSARGWP